ncbi:MAG: XRE family transcriptional regulator [Bacteroidetes bacterium]|nr:MAG: XRE family transcriptional regulator [Bacteroidota bacterium]TAG86113.1 MAG: XRE family transcriptional regulator [Bacteroidota bacterium]
MMSPNFDIGKKIKYFRELKNLTQEEMADKMEMNVKNYRNLENGTTDVGQKHINKIATIFQITPLELLSIGERHLYYIQDAPSFNVNFGSAGFMLQGSITEKEKEIILEINRLKQENESQKNYIDKLEALIKNKEK